jgi:hypothetical protein
VSSIPDFPLVDPRDDGIRPTGAPDECFYCKQKVGTPHLCDCTAVHQKVRIRATFEIDVSMPHHWTRNDVWEWIKDDRFGIELDDLKRGLLQNVKILCVSDPNPSIKIRPITNQQSDSVENN